jgi:hypothetical protein
MGLRHLSSIKLNFGKQALFEPLIFVVAPLAGGISMSSTKGHTSQPRGQRSWVELLIMAWGSSLRSQFWDAHENRQPGYQAMVSDPHGCMHGN